MSFYMRLGIYIYKIFVFHFSWCLKCYCYTPLLLAQPCTSIPVCDLLISFLLSSLLFYWAVENFSPVFRLSSGCAAVYCYMTGVNGVARWERDGKSAVSTCSSPESPFRHYIIHFTQIQHFPIAHNHLIPFSIIPRTFFTLHIYSLLPFASVVIWNSSNSSVRRKLAQLSKYVFI